MIKMIYKGLKRRKNETRYVSLVTFVAVLFMTGITLFQSIMNEYLFSMNLYNYGDWVISSVNNKCEHPYLLTESSVTTGMSVVDEEGVSLNIYAGKTDDDFETMYEELLYEGRMPEKVSILHLKDKEVSRLRRSQIGFVYQDYSLLPEFTAYENIILPIRLDEKTPETEKIEELMQVLGILSCKDKFPGEMSGGEQQRVAIARAIATSPAVILADEPTGNLDCENSNEVVTLMRKAAKMYHQTIIMVTHDMQTADYADRIIRIQDGEIE